MYDTDEFNRLAEKLTETYISTEDERIQKTEIMHDHYYRNDDYFYHNFSYSRCKKTYTSYMSYYNSTYMYLICISLLVDFVN